jgi:hypothetical protein
MSCQQYEGDLVDLARTELAEGDAADCVRRHLEACEACAARFERERQLTGGFRTLSAATTVPPNDVAERRLMTAFASARQASPSPDRVATIGRWTVWAAAACIFFFVGAWAAVEWRARTALPQGTPTSAQASLPAAAEQAKPVRRVESPVPALGPIVSETRRTPASRAVRSALRNELPQEADRLAGFIPLPAADGLPGFDSGMIVRVALPTASLPAFGLAIAPEATQTVNADLLVGQDGQARAIRLVSLVGGSRREPQ